jgi:hypothetical protein
MKILPVSPFKSIKYIMSLNKKIAQSVYVKQFQQHKAQLRI